MASVALSNITQITRSIAAGFGTGLQLAGAPITAYRIASGQAPGDTAALTPAPELGNVRSVFGPVQNNLPTSGTGATNVTVTITGNGSTATVGQIDVWLVGSPAS